MAAAAALWTEPNGPKGQIGVIENHQQVLQLDPIKAHESTDSLAARVHIRLRLAKENSALVLIHSRQPHCKFRFRSPTRAPIFGQLLYRHEPDIVAGAGVLSAWVAQSRNDVALLHAGSGQRPRRLLFLLRLLFGAFVGSGLVAALFGSFFRGPLCCRSGCGPPGCWSGCGALGASGRSSALFLLLLDHFDIGRRSSSGSSISRLLGFRNRRSD